MTADRNLTIFFSTKSWVACVAAAALLGCGGGGGGGQTAPGGGGSLPSDPSPTPTNATTTIGAAGGELSTSDVAVKIQVPQEAVAQDTKFGISIATADQNSEAIGGNTIELTPSGTVFKSPIKLSVKYDPKWLDPEWSPSALALGRWTGTSWEKFSTTLDLTQSRIAADIPGFSTWAPVLVGGSNSSPDYSWQVNNGCLRTTNADYNRKLDSLANLLFSAAPTDAVGCITGPYLENDYSKFISSMQNHAGLDFRAPKGTPIFAPIGGEVVLETLDIASKASTLTIESEISGQVIRTLYLHCGSHEQFRGSQSLGLLKVGSKVLAGDRVCSAGSVGALSPHLHFEVKAKPLDAENLRAMSGSRGACITSSFENGWNSSTSKFDLSITKPGCSLSDIRNNTQDPTGILDLISLPSGSNVEVSSLSPRSGEPGQSIQVFLRGKNLSSGVHIKISNGSSPNDGVASKNGLELISTEWKELLKRMLSLKDQRITLN